LRASCSATFSLPIPSHGGATSADFVAKQAAFHGRKPKFKIFTDLYTLSKRYLENKFRAFLEDSFRKKSAVYYSYFFSSSIKFWFFRYSLI